jgi:hypothetical protein
MFPVLPAVSLTATPIDPLMSEPLVEPFDCHRCQVVVGENRPIALDPPEPLATVGSVTASQFVQPVFRPEVAKTTISSSLSTVVRLPQTGAVEPVAFVPLSQPASSIS